LAAELLKRGAELVRAAGVHPTAVISGYRRAARDACAFVKDHLAIPVASLGDDALAAVARTSMSSKVIGGGGRTTEHFASLLVDAVKAVKTERIEGGGASAASTSVVKYPVSAVTVLKARGGSLLDSQLIRGVALNLGKAAAGMPSRVGGGGDKTSSSSSSSSSSSVARIACLDVNLQKARMHLGVQVLITDPSELEAIRAREADIAKERIAKILEAGANVVFTTKGIDDLCLKYFVEAGVMAARRVPKDALRRVAKATGATLVTSLADEEGGEAFDASCLGVADAVVEENVAGDDIIVVRGGHGGKKRRKEAAEALAASNGGGEVAAASSAAADDEDDDDAVFAEGGGATLLLRGANDYLLDEAERAAHDAMCVVRRVLESGSVVPGGGAAEAAISVFLERGAPSLAPREQLAVAEASEAVLAVPRALASNAARDGADLVSKLRAYHFRAQKAAEDKAAGKTGEEIEKDLVLARCGLDLENGLVRDSVSAGVLEPAGGKISALRFAAEAAITILRIDDLIRVEPAGDDQ